MPNPREVAVIVVNGEEVTDWETVWVRIEMPSMWRTFRFSVSEGNPPKKNFTKLQIKPGDVAEIYLAGELVIASYVLERQAYYDADRHGVMISGQSKVAVLTNVSIIHKGGQFRNRTLPQIAEEVKKPHDDIKVILKGSKKYMNVPFQDVQIMLTEAPFHCIERLGQMRACFVTDDKDGNLVIHGGGEFSSGPALVEGQNIKWARATINDREIMKQEIAVGQAWAYDKKWGKPYTQPKATIYTDIMRNKIHKFLVNRPLNPDTMLQELKMAAQYETAWRLATEIRVEVGVQGWLKPGGGLWEVMAKIPVYSPMLMITETLTTQAVTFTQINEEGTMTVLELCNPLALNPGNIQVGQTYQSKGGGFAQDLDNQ